MRCGPPFKQYQTHPIKIIEKRGDQTTEIITYIKSFLYPRRGNVYYLKIENGKVISIDYGEFGKIPK